MLELEELLADERAIEGLPVRLVIAFVVGVAALGVMLNLVSGVGGLGASELDARPQPDVISPGQQQVTVEVVDSQGRPVGGATVVVRGGTARLDAARTVTTGDNGTATVAVAPSLAPNQMEGTLDVSIKPPAGTEYVDRRGNTEILVLSDGSAALPVDPVVLPSRA